VGHQLGRLGLLSGWRLVGRTHLWGTAVSLVGGDPGVPSLTSPRARCRCSDLRKVMTKSKSYRQVK
jgi:hypothetical protein